MREVFQLVRRAAASRATVLIRGESGTGQGAGGARPAPALRPGRAGRSSPISCAALPETLLESELFGYEKNAFTGAVTASKPGRFELADKGTLFLDEIGDISPPVQIKLLRAPAGARLRAHRRGQDDQGRRAGGRRDQRRPGAAREGRQVPLRPLLPPAGDPARRCRRCATAHEDIAGLCRRVPAPLRPSRTPARTHGDPAGRAAHILLNEYAWPGNVRELENVMERCVVMADPGAEQLDAGPAAGEGCGLT